MILTHDWQYKQIQTIQISIVDKEYSWCSLKYHKSERNLVYCIKIDDEPVLQLLYSFTVKSK